MAWSRLCRYVATFPVKRKFGSSGQVSDEALVGIRICPAQLVVEVDHREHDPEFFTQFEQEPQKGNRIRAPRDGDAQAVAGLQQLFAPDAGQDSMLEVLHKKMVSRIRAGITP
jgi:hypothetical protein